jgi:dynein heavy chain, axonemal
MSENIISIYLNDFEDMPWDALRYMISAINYGGNYKLNLLQGSTSPSFPVLGHVTDGCDQRLLTSYSEQCFAEDTIKIEDYK